MYICLHYTCTWLPHMYGYTIVIIHNIIPIKDVQLRYYIISELRSFIFILSLTLFWIVQQSFYLHHFHIIILTVLYCVCEISIHCFINELQYNHDIKLYTILHITSSHTNIEATWMYMYVNRHYNSYKSNCTTTLIII